MADGRPAKYLHSPPNPTSPQYDNYTFMSGKPFESGFLRKSRCNAGLRIRRMDQWQALKPELELEFGMWDLGSHSDLT